MHAGERSTIKKRHMHMTEELFQQNPQMCAFDGPSLDARQAILVGEVPRLGAAAALKAIKEWGQPLSKITHLVFCTRQAVDMPGADYQLLKMLGLDPSVRRVMLYQHGCFAGGTVLRVAKDLAENNLRARVLVVCSEITAVTFRGPSATGSHLDNLVAQALFGDGAAAVDGWRRRFGRPAAAWQWGFTGLFGPGRAILGLVCPLCHVRSATAKAVEVVPSRPVGVPLPPSLPMSSLPLGPVPVTTVRRRGRLQDRGGVCWWVACLVEHVGAFRVVGLVVGRNPCRHVRLRRGDACGCCLPS
jgi:hypothetical protein